VRERWKILSAQRERKGGQDASSHPAREEIEDRRERQKAEKPATETQPRAEGVRLFGKRPETRYGERKNEVERLE